MKLGDLAITFEQLGALLGLPPEHEVVGVAPADVGDVANRQIRVVITGPQCPEHPEGAFPQWVHVETRIASGRD